MKKKKQSTAEYYRTHPKARAKHRATQAKINRKPSEVKKRTALNKFNRDHGTAGNSDNRDASHIGNKIVGFLAASKNRGSKSNAPGDKRARGGKSKKK